MTSGKTVTPTDALRIVADMDRKYGDINIFGQRFMNRRDFDLYIAENIGIDRTTVANYLRVFKLFRYIKTDPLDPDFYFFIYKDSDEFKKQKTLNDVTP